MTVNKIIMRAFIFIGKTRKTIFFSESWEFFVAASKKLMGIALMAYIPDNGIFGTIKNSVKSNCKFDNTKIAGKMSTIFSNNVNNCSTDFLS